MQCSSAAKLTQHEDNAINCKTFSCEDWFVDEVEQGTFLYHSRVGGRREFLMEKTGDVN
jgi:hypothetical protein